MEEKSTTPALSGWWGLLDKVKQQTETIVNIYKEDLKEFSNTITNDTKEIIKDPEITSKIGLSGLFGYSQNKPSEKEKISVIVDRHQARILILESELSTYCTEPSDREDFMFWKEEFNLQSKTDEISNLLSDKEKIREAHSKLVPIAVSYSDFWERYYYKMFKLNQVDERRAALVKRATNSTQSDEERFIWDEIEEEDKQSSVVTQQKSDEDWIVVKDAEAQPQSLEPTTKVDDDNSNSKPITKDESDQKEDWDDWE